MVSVSAVYLFRPYYEHILRCRDGGVLNSYTIEKAYVTSTTKPTALI